MNALSIIVKAIKQVMHVCIHGVSLMSLQLSTGHLTFCQLKINAILSSLDCSLSLAVAV